MALYLRVLQGVTEEAVQYVEKITERGITITQYEELTKHTSTFLALVGQVCDMVEAIAAALGKDYICKSTNTFLKERNNLIHAARIPMGIDYAGVYVAIIALSDDVPGYRNRVEWSSVKPEQYRYMSDWFRDTTQGLFDAINRQVHPAIKAEASAKFTMTKARPVQIPETQRMVGSDGPLTTFTCPISGAMNPYPPQQGSSID